MPRLLTPRYLRALCVVTYLCAAGWFLVLAPWSRIWLGMVVPNAPYWLIAFLESGVLRGALSGFGVLHFVIAYTWLQDAALAS